MMFYTMVCGWMIDYTVKAIGGKVPCIIQVASTVFPDAVATVSHCFIHNCETGFAGREKADITLEDNLFFANDCHYNTDKDDSPILPEGNYIATEKQAVMGTLPSRSNAFRVAQARRG